LRTSFNILSVGSYRGAIPSKRNSPCILSAQHVNSFVCGHGINADAQRDQLSKSKIDKIRRNPTPVFLPSLPYFHYVGKTLNYLQCAPESPLFRLNFRRFRPFADAETLGLLVSYCSCYIRCVERNRPRSPCFYRFYYNAFRQSPELGVIMSRYKISFFLVTLMALAC